MFIERERSKGGVGYRGRMDPTEAAETSEPAFYPPSPPWGSNAKLMVVGMAFVLSIVGVYLIRNVLAIAALAALIAFLVAPLIRLGVRHLHIPRGVALLLAYLVVFIGTVAFGAMLARSIVESVVELDPIGLVDEVRLWLLRNADANGHVILFGLTIDISEFVDSLQSSVLPGDGDGAALDAERILEYLGAGFSGVRTVLGIVTALITSAIITTLVAMYLNADSGRLHDATMVSVPAGYERDGYMMMAKQKSVWRGYLYGQLVNSLITGFFVFVVLWVVGLPGAFLMGMIMVVLNMIPTFGPILAAIPGVLAALLSGSTRWPDLENYWFALVVVIIYLLVVQLQANIIAPRVMGTAVNLRPAIVLIGLMVGFQVGGLLGSLLAVPVIASIRDVGVYIWRKLIDADPWPDVEEIPVPSDP
jgi:predicted PurR-regulated permease PerM